MNLVLERATIVTCDATRRIIEDGAIAIAGGRIAAVGTSEELRRLHPDWERLSLKGRAVLPGFINAHTHTLLNVLRGTVEDMSGDAIYGFMTPISFVMTPGERAAMARLGCLEAIRSGCSGLVDPFRHVVEYAEAMADSGLRLWLSESCADARTLEIRHGVYRYDRAWGETFLDRARALIETWHGARDGRVQVQISAHAPDNCSPWMLGELNGLARRHGLTRTVHLAQGRGEVEQLRRAENATPAEYLDRHDWLAPDVVGAHWTFCSESDIDLLAERGVQMAHCPASSSRRGPHKVRADRIIERGINIALGTDNMSEDMFQAMRLGIIVHRGAFGGGVRPQPQALLDGATRNAAQSVGRLAELGSIEQGKLADLTIIDLNDPSLRPIINLPSNLVHCGTPACIESVMVAGEFIMREGRVLTMDQAEVVGDAQRAAESAWRRLLDQAPDLPRPAGM
ncbi:amidohydrolase family protein [Geminicoccaceae bacterium 1502E]|nr:amidohydrolase family protein [Geminicoccaceae bacterium 1502E]